MTIFSFNIHLKSFVNLLYHNFGLSKIDNHTLAIHKIIDVFLLSSLLTVKIGEYINIYANAGSSSLGGALSIAHLAPDSMPDKAE